MQTTEQLPLAPGHWAVDTNHAAVGFAIRHLGVSKVRGRFARFEASVEIGQTLADTTVTATIDLSSVDTGNADRDAHIQAPDMLDVAVNPTLTFRSTSIEGAGDDWKIHGDVTIGERTAPVTLAVELGGIQEMNGQRSAGFEATGELHRSDFGICPGVPSAMLGEVIKLQIDLELFEPTAG